MSVEPLLNLMIRNNVLWGGVVLFLLMLFIYGTLKLVLVFSSVPEGEYKLSAPLIDEEVPVIETSVETSANNNNSLASVANNTPLSSSSSSSLSSNTQAPSQSHTENYRMPGKFIFLNLNGKPMRPNLESLIVHKPTTTRSNNVNPGKIFDKPIGENRWYVQAASFKSEEQAQRLIQKIKNKNVANQAYILRLGSWYAVRLHPTTHGLADEQRQKLRQRLSLRPVVRELK